MQPAFSNLWKPCFCWLPNCGDETKIGWCYFLAKLFQYSSVSFEVSFRCFRVAEALLKFCKLYLFGGEIFSRESCTTSGPRRGFPPQKKVGGDWWEVLIFLDFKKTWLRMYDNNSNGCPSDQKYLLIFKKMWFFGRQFDRVTEFRKDLPQATKLHLQW